MGAIKAGVLEARMLSFVQDNRIHVVPPCVITDEQAQRGLEIYRQVLAGA
ncbi:MAG: hypothetical protein V9G19_11630 [Tetrasphaera sp.]